MVNRLGELNTHLQNNKGNVNNTGCTASRNERCMILATHTYKNCVFLLVKIN
jgi:hypothetical protein